MNQHYVPHTWNKNFIIKVSQFNTIKKVLNITFDVQPKTLCL